MATGPQALEKLCQEKGMAADNHLWVDVLEKLDLCKLKVSDLTATGIDQKDADKIISALNHLDIGPLGDALGIRLRVKFKAWADTDGSVCKIRAEGSENSKWLQSYLCSKLLDLKVTEPKGIEDTPLYRFDVTQSEASPLWKIQKALIECPAITLMRVFSVRIAERPHYLVQASNLASWIDAQGEETWWRVDGDPLLMSSLEFPSPPDELAGELREIDKPLLVSDPNEDGSGEEVVPEELSHLVDSNEFGVRALYLSWKDGLTDWLLIEDEPTSESSSGI